MPPQDQTTHFAHDLERLINRYRAEYDLPLAYMVGTLHIQSALLILEAKKRSEDDDDSE